MGRRKSASSYVADLDQILQKATGYGIADLAHDAIEAAISHTNKAGSSEITPPAPGSREEASVLLGVRLDAEPEIVEAARRVLLRQVKGGETSIGGDEQRAKRINAAADLLLRRS